MDLSFNSATQYVLTVQPIYEVAGGFINFGVTTTITPPNTSSFLNMSNGAYPYGTSSYTYVLRNRALNNGQSQNAFFYGGDGNYQTAAIQLDWNNVTGFRFYIGTTVITNNTYGNPPSNNILTSKYQNGSGVINFYINSTLYTTTFTEPRSQLNTYNVIGGGGGKASASTYYYQGGITLDYFYVFNTSLTPGTDQTLIEGTPYQYSAPASITGLAASSMTVTNFVLGWTAYTGATLYTIYVNSVFITSTTLTSLTITPGFYGPWNINVYAFNASNALIATGYITLNVSPVVTIIPITNNVSWPAVSNTLTTQSLTATNTGYAALNGTYTVTCSIAATNADTRVYIGAILSNNNGVMWQSPSGIYAVSAGTGGGQNLYTVNTGRSTTASGTSYSGEWFTFQFPAPITLSIFTIAQQWGPPSNIYQFYLVGSNDGSTWTYMYGATAAYNAGASTQNFTVNSSQGFTYIRFIVNSVAANQGIWLSYVNMTGNGIGF
jgi:hypothetical protein